MILLVYLNLCVHGQLEQQWPVHESADYGWFRVSEQKLMEEALELLMWGVVNTYQGRDRLLMDGQLPRLFWGGCRRLWGHLLVQGENLYLVALCYIPQTHEWFMSKCKPVNQALYVRHCCGCCKNVKNHSMGHIKDLKEKSFKGASIAFHKLLISLWGWKGLVRLWFRQFRLSSSSRQRQKNWHLEWQKW